MQKTLTGLESDGVITIDRDPNDPQIIQSVQLSPLERDSGRENYDFYCFLIWPFIEGSWLAGVALIGLTPPLPSSPIADAAASTEVDKAQGTLWVPAKATQEMAQLLGKTLYHQGDLSYFEAVNKQSIANTFLQSQEEGIIIVKKPTASPRVEPPGATATTASTDPSDPTPSPAPVPINPAPLAPQPPLTGPFYRLASEWQPSRDPITGAIIPQGRLWDFVEKIAKSRREGKNRRDGKTVSKRVLGLVGELGEELFRMYGTVMGEGGEAVMVGVEGSSKKRRRGAKELAKL